MNIFYTFGTPYTPNDILYFESNGRFVFYAKCSVESPRFGEPIRSNLIIAMKMLEIKAQVKRPTKWQPTHQVQMVVSQLSCDLGGSNFGFLL